MNDNNNIKDQILKYNLKTINNNKFDDEINPLINNRFKINKNINLNENKNILFTSNWNHSSNYRLSSHANENILYKDKFFKSTPLRDKLINENNNRVKGIILPDIKTPNYKRDNVNLNANNNFSSQSNKTPIVNISENRINLNNELSTDKTSFYRNVNLNKITNTNSNYLSDNTQTTSIATNSTKKQTSSKNNNIQSVNEELNQYGMGVISGGATTNNNIIIPILTMRRPASNFNCGGGILHNFNENEFKFGKKIDKFDNINKLKNIDKPEIKRNKNCKSQEVKARFNIKNQELLNILPSMQNLIPNFHKIKIEKGMNNIKLGNSLSKKISFENNNLLNNNKIKIKNNIQ